MMQTIKALPNIFPKGNPASGSALNADAALPPVQPVTLPDSVSENFRYFSNGVKMKVYVKKSVNVCSAGNVHLFVRVV